MSAPVSRSSSQPPRLPALQRGRRGRRRHLRRLQRPGVDQFVRRRREQGPAHRRHRLRQRQSWDPTQTASAFSHGRQQPHLRGPGRHRPDHPRAVPGAGHRAAGRTSADTSWKFTLRAGRQVARRAAGHRRRRGLHPSTGILDPSAETLDAGLLRQLAEGGPQGRRRRPSSWSSSSRSRTGSSGSPSPRSCRSTSSAPPGGWDDAIKNGKAVGSGPYKQTAHHPKSNTDLRGVRGLQRAAQGRAFKKMNWLSIVDASAAGRQDLRRRRRGPDRRQHPVRQHRPAHEGRADGRGRQGHEPHVPDVQHAARSPSTTCGYARRCSTRSTPGR